MYQSKQEPDSKMNDQKRIKYIINPKKYSLTHFPSDLQKPP